MRMRRMMLGLIGTIAVCAAATGKPPGLPVPARSEGREVDPVTREFYLPEKPSGALSETPVASRSTNTAAEATVWAILAGLHDIIMNRLTMPLGTVPQLRNADCGMRN